MKKRIVVGLALIGYCVLLIKVMVFKDVPVIRMGDLTLNFSGTNAGHAGNLTPFKTILWYLHGGHGMIIGGINLLGNIILLVPIGFMVTLLDLKLGWKKMLALGVVMGLSIESIQVLLKVGIFDIDDVLLNTFGVMMGYCIYLLLVRWITRRQYGRIVVATAVVVMTAVAAFYSLFPGNEREGGSEMDREVSIRKRNNRSEGSGSRGHDLCGGTGGTGQIVDVRKGAITLRRNDGKGEVIRLTARTKFRTSAGPASESVLQAGQRVTVVTDQSETAVLILICDGEGSLKNSRR